MHLVSREFRLDSALGNLTIDNLQFLGSEFFFFFFFFYWGSVSNEETG